jgi:sugar phosphate isomerase/epimerase
MKMNRRDFLQALGLSSAFAAAGCKCPFSCGGHPIALQLWSINKIMWKTMPAEEVFEKIREIGFDGVEFAGYNGKSAKEIRKLLKDAGLRGMGAHVGGNANYTGDKLKANLDFCAEAGLESLTNPWAKFETADAWKKFGEDMGKAAETAKAWNIPVSFHNHFHEFTMKYNGVCAWDLIFQNSSPLLQQQLDSGQVVHPGEDCVERVNRYRGRNFSMHMKENTPSEWGFFGVAPDDGGKIVPWKDLVNCLENEPSFKWYVIESERKPDSFLPAEKNLAYLKALV